MLYLLVFFVTYDLHVFLQVANESDAIVLKFGLTLQQIMDVVSLSLSLSLSCITLQQIMDVFSQCLPLGGFLLFALAGINCIKMPAVDKIDEAALLKAVDAIIFLL